MPLIFVVCEAIRSWLADNNIKGLDDASMHAQMMRRAKEAERSKVSGNTVYFVFVFIVHCTQVGWLFALFWGVCFVSILETIQMLAPCFRKLAI
jgi:hypothetical protein